MILATKAETTIFTLSQSELISLFQGIYQLQVDKNVMCTNTAGLSYMDETLKYLLLIQVFIQSFGQSLSKDDCP